eukprot:1177037-Pyramimonas_sp.AAC.1
MCDWKPLNELEYRRTVDRGMEPVTFEAGVECRFESATQCDMEFEGDSGPQEDEGDKDSDTESILEDITEEEEGLAEKEEGDEEETARAHPGDQINQIIVQAATSVPHSTGRWLSRPRKPEIPWSLEEDMRRLRREAKWECKMIRKIYWRHKR